MSIDIYTSRQRAGVNPARDFLINKIVNDYKNASFSERRKMFIVTPKQNTYQIERELIEKIGEGGLFGIEIEDQERLLKKIYESSQNQFEVVDEHGRLMLMQKTLKDLQDDLRVYNRSIQKAGFSQELIDQFSEFKAAQIDENLLESKLENIDNHLLKEKIKDLNLIFKQFNENLGQNRVDEDDLKNLSLELINKTDYFKDAKIYFIDFSNLNSQDALLINQAAQKAKNIDIALTTDLNRNSSDFSAFESVNNDLDLLRKQSKAFNSDLNIYPIDFDHVKKDSLSFLSDQLFSYSPLKFNHPLINVSIFSENDPWSEANRVAQLISLDNKQGTNFSEISVTIPESDIYENIIKRVFSQYNIPVFIDDNHQVIDNHFIQTLLNALDAVNNNYRRNEILAYLKSDFSNLTKDEIDLFENYLIEAGIKNWEWKKPFKRIPTFWNLEEDELSEDHKINEIRERIISDLSIFNKKTNKTFNDYANSLIKFLENLKSEEKLQEISDDLFNEGYTDLSLRYRQIWNILIEIIDQIKNTLGDSPTDLSEFINVLRTGLTSYEIGVIPEEQDAVIISKLARSKLPKIKSLYILGLNEGILPREIGESSLFSQREKSDISDLLSLNNNELKTNQFFHQLEENDLYNFISKPTDKITFSYSEFDNNGSPQLPSRYIKTLEDIFGSSVYPPVPKIFPILNKDNAEIIVEVLDEKDEQNRFIGDVIKSWIELNNEDDIEVLDELAQEVLKTVNIEELYNGNRSKINISISRLEQFAGCPYKHFVLYGLRPKNREEYEVRALDTGIIIHEVFDVFIKTIKENTNDAVEFKEALEEYLKNTEKFEKDVNLIFDTVFERLEDAKRYELTAASRYLIKKIKRIIYVSLYIMARQMVNSNFVPDSMEQSFYQTDEKYILNGRIDRIDVPVDEDDKTIRVIDYKTGKKSLEYSDIYHGLSLQLALYLLKAVETYNKNNNSEVKPGGGLYFLTDNILLNNPSNDSIEEELYKNYQMDGIFSKEFKTKASDEIIRSNSKYKPTNLEEDELNKLLKYTEFKVDELTEKLRSGEISIKPTVNNGIVEGCAYCNYRDICRFNPNKDSGNEISKMDKDQFFAKVKGTIDGKNSLDE